MQGRRSRVGRVGWVGHGPPNSQATYFFSSSCRSIATLSIEATSSAQSIDTRTRTRVLASFPDIPITSYPRVRCLAKYGDCCESPFTLAETSRFRRRNLVQGKGLANHSGSLTTHSFTTTWNGTLFSVTLV